MIKKSPAKTGHKEVTLAEEDMYACTEVEDNNDDTLLKQYTIHIVYYT